MRQSLHFLHPHPWHNSWSFQASRSTCPQLQTSLFPLFLVLQRGEGALAQPGAVCAHTTSAPLEQPEHLPPDWQGRTGRDLPGDLSSITNPVADKLSASCRLRPSKVRADQSSTHSLLWHSTACILGGAPKTCLRQPKICPSIGLWKGHICRAAQEESREGKGNTVQWPKKVERTSNESDQIHCLNGAP